MTFVWRLCMWLTSFDFHVLWASLCNSSLCLLKGPLCPVASITAVRHLFAQAKAGSSDRISLLSSVRILFFWKLVSHGGLDFSIFVSSTIWNQCFRSKTCSTAKGHLQRSCCPGTSSPPPATWAGSRKEEFEKKSIFLNMLGCGRGTVQGWGCVQ